MKKTLKRVISVMVALAMVVTSISYSPIKVNAQTYSDYTFTEVSGMNGTYSYCVVENTIGVNTPEFYDSNYMKLAYSATNTLENTVITVDGTTKTVADNEVFECATGMTTFNLAALGDDAYHELKVTSTNGSVLVIVKKGNPDGGTEETTSEETTSDDNTSATDELAAPTKLVIYNYRQTNEGYKVVFKDANDITLLEGEEYYYEVYVDNGGYKLVGTVTASGEFITSDGMDSIGLTEGNTYATYIRAVYKKTDATIYSGYGSGSMKYDKTQITLEKTGLASIVIQTADNSVNLWNDASKTKANSTIMVYDTDGETVLHSDYGTANVRGNSTAGAAKKAYNIKFNSKYDLLGLGQAKKFSLLANAFDKSLLRNALAMKFGSAIGVPYNSNCKFVDVYVNGRYMGNYLLIESIETGSTRVDIDSENTEEYNKDVLLELENNGKDEEGCTYIKTTTYEQRFVMESPESSKDITEEFFEQKVSDTLKFLNDFETALASSDLEEIKKYINIDSFINFYIVSEYFKVQDIDYSSTRFFIKDGVLYAGPLWDYDLSSGNVSVSYYGTADQSPEGYRAKNMKWFKALMSNYDFLSLVRARYTELIPTIQSLYEGDGNAIDTFLDEMGASAALNYTSADEGGAGWSIGTKDQADGYSYANTYSFSSYSESVEQLRDWLKARCEYLREVWDAEYIVQSDIDTSLINDWTTIGNECSYKDTESNTEYTYYISEAFKTSDSYPFSIGHVIRSSISSSPYYDAGYNKSESNNFEDGFIYSLIVSNEGEKITSVVIDGEKYFSGDKYVLVQNDRVYINVKAFASKARSTDETHVVTVNASQEYTYALMIQAKSTEEDETTSSAQGQTPSQVAGLVYAGTGDLPYYWAWQRVSGATSYNVYVDGTYITNVTTASVNLVDYAGLFAYNGNYVIGVTAVNEYGESEITTVNYTVTDKEDAPATETETATEAETETETATEAETETVEQPSIDADSITDWVQLTGTSVSGATIWVSQAVADTMGNAGLRGFYDAGKSVNWNISDAFKQIDVFGFVTTGSNATSVVINGIEYTSDDENVCIGSDCVYINQNLVDADLGEVKYYTITATSTSVGTSGTFVVKVVGEQAPDISEIDVDGWTEITGGDGAADDSKYYYATTNDVTNGNMLQLLNDGQNATYGAAGTVLSEIPVFAFSVKSGNNPSTIWLSANASGNVTHTKLSEDKIYINGDCIQIAQSAFDLEGSSEKVFYITLRYSDGTDVILPVKVVAGNTWSDWSEINDASGDDTIEYYCATWSANTLNLHANTRELLNTIIIVFNEGIATAAIEGIDSANITVDGAGVQINKEVLLEGEEYILTVSNSSKSALVKIKYEHAVSYVPTGFTAATTWGEISSKSDDVLTVSWTATADATAAGYTYGVVFNKETVTAAQTATFNLSDVEYGTYDVILYTYDTEGNVVDTQTISYIYADPTVIENTLNVVYEWEHSRTLTASWSQVGSATGYAIYADGVLVGTTTDVSYDVAAYYFANNTVTHIVDGKEITQATTVGEHSVAVVALFDDEDAPSSYSEAEVNHVIGSDDFSLYVNYIYGNTTDIWNDTGVDSVWNFTICESADADDINEGAEVVASYDDSGAVELVILNNGEHAGKDQPWTVKAAIYDEDTYIDEMVNLTFDILGPSELVGQNITIRCYPEEWVNGEYGEATYHNKTYTFEAVYDAEGNVISSVIHVSATFKAKTDTYDLLFGLGELDATTLTLTDANLVKLYGVTDVSSTGTVNVADTSDNSIYVSWETNVPDVLKDYYTYLLKICDESGKVIYEDDNAKSGSIITTEEGIGLGNYKIEVSSVYNESVTATKSADTVIETAEVYYPDLVISDMKLADDSVSYRIGDRVEFDITMTNVGSKDAVISEGNITAWLQVYNPTEETLDYIGYFTVDKIANEETGVSYATLAVGESVTGKIAYTITEQHCGEGYSFVFTASADADGKVTESDETNNTYSKTYTFNAAIKEVTLINDGEDISASWPASDDNDLKSYTVEYTNANGEKVTAVSATENYTLPDGEYFANESSVIVYVTCNDGTTYEYAKGTALADLIITSMNSIEGVAYVGESTSIVAVVKNIGVAAAEGKSQIISATLSADSWSNYGTINNQVLNPNESFDITVTGYTATAVGTKQITGRTNDVNWIKESDTTNNYYYLDLPAIYKGEVNVVNTDGEVSVEWTDTNKEDLTVEGYKILYTNSDGDEITKEIAVSDGTEYIFDEYLKNNTKVTILVKYEEFDSYLELGNDTAIADLIVYDIDFPLEKEGYLYTEKSYDIPVVIKNIGTALVPATEDNLEHYGYWIIGSLTADSSDVSIPEGAYSVSGLNPGATYNMVFKNVTISEEGTYEFTSKVDDPGFELADANGFIAESDETNNVLTKEVQVKFVQNTEMEWTVLTDAGSGTGNPYVFPVASGSQDAYIYYKVLSTTYENLDYEDIITNYQGYNGANMNITFNGQFSDAINYIGTMNGNALSNTVFDFYQVPNWKEFDSEGNENDPVVPGYSSNYWLTVSSQATYIQDTSLDGSTTIINPDPSTSPTTYVGNGLNYFVGNFGLYKCYVFRFTTPVVLSTATDEEGNTVYTYDYNEDGTIRYDETIVAFKVTDNNAKTGSWTQAAAADSSNINALPIPYCGGDEWADCGATIVNPLTHEAISGDGKFEIDDTGYTENEHEATEGSCNYETTGAFWYDNGDILLSSVSVYNGNWLSIATSQYLDIDVNNYRMAIARAETDENNNNAYTGYATDFVMIEPGEHLGIQGTNTILVGLPWLFEKLPTHSGKSDEKDVDYYWIRLYADYTNIVDENAEDEVLANYIDIPVVLYYDVPQVQPAQNVKAIATYDDDDQTVFTLSWGTIAEQNAYGYKYKVFIPDEADECTADDPAGTLNDIDITEQLAELNGITLTDYGYFTAAEVLNANNTLYNASKGKLKVVAYWCEQEIATVVDISDPHIEGWYAIDGENTIGIQAGKSMPVEMDGYISYYYDQSVNHASAVVGYNGYYVSLNGNSKYFSENSVVSVYRGYNSRSELHAVYDMLYEKEGYDASIQVPQFEEVVIDYNYINGQLQIMAKNLMTASNLVTWYLVKVETPVTTDNPSGDVVYDDEGNAKYVSYIMLESIVETGGGVDIRGFQMNTDASYGAVSEYSPSFRVVSRASRILADNTNALSHQSDVYNVDPETNAVSTTALYTAGTINSFVEAIVARGTIYGRNSQVTDDIMTVSVSKDADGNVQYDEDGNIITSTDEESGVYHVSTTEGGILNNWSGSVNDTDKDAYTYYAVTFKPMSYSVKSLQDEYSVKAYAVTEEGDIIYEDDVDENPVKTASVYKIAEILYHNSSMYTEQDHEFLYNNVLNIVAIADNYTTIGKAMLKALNVKDKATNEYRYVNNAYKDLYYYAHLAMNYAESSYVNRGTFISKTVVDGVYNEELLLPLLNDATSTLYETVADWIYSEVNHETGFYEKVEYVNPNASGTVDAGTQV